MNNRLAEIFVKFMQIMRENNSNFKKAQIDLLNDGYSLLEIESTLEWYFGEMHRQPEEANLAERVFLKPSPKSFRCFTLEEERCLSAEARTYMTEMLYIGAISLEEIEGVISILKEYLMEDASIDAVHNIMIGFRSLDISAVDGSEDNINFKIRYLQ